MNKNMHNFKLKELKIRILDFLEQESNMITKKKKTNTRIKL